MSKFFLMALSPIVLIHVFYLIAIRTKNLSVIDTAWGLGFILISLTGCVISDWSNSQENLLFMLVLIWGLRLASFIHLRNHGNGEDFRYANWRKDWGEKTNLIAYFKVYWLQLFLMIIVGLPIFVSHRPGPLPLTMVQYVGALIWLIGFLWESVADHQKSKFKAVPGNKEKVFQGGLWSLSRHPNYFGEALLWWGLGLVSVSSHNYWGLLGSAFITFLLCRVSGIPLVEKRHEHNPEYQAYASKTPSFIPSISKMLK